MFVLCYFSRALYWLVYRYSDYSKVIEYFTLGRLQSLTFYIFVIRLYTLLLLLPGKLYTHHAGITFIYTVRLSGALMGQVRGWAPP